FHRDGDEVLRFEIAQVRLAARPGDGLGFHGEHAQVVREATATLDRIETRLRNLEPQDLVAVTMEAAAMARVPLAGTDWIPGRSTF
ncbi:FMN-binding glutamate synthase family protein, partial [Rhodococcus rhodochrous]|nr:FMN-binding glutamate synthase family protein [Rhodococcus rhodochrous]